VLGDFRARKTPGGTFDLMIASITIASQSKLLSRNLKDFERMPGLVVEDWLS
jgi:tRNA(fMet)-specific endonuclease VapC